MKTPHKHAELIKQWADGAQIQYKEGDFWYNCVTPSWKKGIEYRVKPEPKPDVVLYACISLLNHGVASIKPVNADTRKVKTDTCMFVFDGETGELKDAQVLEQE